MRARVRLAAPEGVERAASAVVATVSGRAGRWAVLLGSTLLGLAVLEAGVRGFGLAPATKSLGLGADHSAYQRSDNPLLGFELKPGYRNASPDYTTSYPFTNAHGQRDREHEIEKPAGVRRVLLLGDSVVEGSGVRELDDTIGGQLQQQLGAGSEVLNFGVSGYCTRAEIELLETKGLAFDPDVVVVVFVENDFDNFNTQLTDLAVQAPESAAARWAFHRSALFRLLSLRLAWFGVTPSEDPFERMRSALGDQNVVDGLQRLSELAETEGFMAMLGVWPHFATDGVTDPHPMGDGSGALVVERLAEGLGIPTFRFSDTFRRDFEQRAGPGTPRSLYTVQSDTMHPNPLAASVAASAIVQSLAVTTRRVAAPAGSGEVDAAALDLARAKGEREPERFKIHANVGNELAARGDFAAAIEAFERALAEEQSDGWRAVHHYNLGLAAENAGDHERAKLAYRTAVALRPDQTPAAARLRRLTEDTPHSMQAP